MLDKQLEQVKALKDRIPLLDNSSKEFAQSLIDNIHRYGRLSDKQEYWVAQLIARADNPPVVLKPVDVGSFKGVFDLFAVARKNLKYPKVTMAIESQPVQLSLAGPNSKYKNKVMVTDGMPYGHNRWFGTVDSDGRWEPSKSVTVEDMELVGLLLVQLSEDPAKTASEYGRLTGNCCFCNAKLTDDHSTAAGFGPVCAKNFGLFDNWKAASAVLKEGVKNELA